MISRKQVSEEQKKSILKEFHSGGKVTDLSKNYQVPIAVIEEWVKQDKLFNSYVNESTVNCNINKNVDNKHNKKAKKPINIGNIITSLLILGASVFLLISVLFYPIIPRNQKPDFTGNINLDSLFGVENDMKAELQKQDQLILNQNSKVIHKVKINNK